MTDFSKFHKVIRERITAPGAYYYADPWWEVEVKQFTIDLNESIKFIETECTDEEFYWLDEVFDDILEKTPNREDRLRFWDCISKRVQRVENPDWKKEILGDLVSTKEDYVD